MVGDGKRKDILPFLIAEMVPEATRLWRRKFFFIAKALIVGAAGNRRAGKKNPARRRKKIGLLRALARF